ncbi:hypothetical protein [Rubrivirga sp. IMCC45206]|uniref:hypothetical protein n=1 Tax=Rubrivirga sp. IMCC45206 TaxID=3391614 RepID=UPI00398F9F47
MLRTVGSIGPVDRLVEFTSAFAPDEMRVRLRRDYAEHTGADGVTRLEALQLRPAEVQFPMRLVPTRQPVSGAPGETASVRLLHLEGFLAYGVVCPLFLGSAYLGNFVVTDLDVTYRDPAMRFIDVSARLLEYDGSLSTGPNDVLDERARLLARRRRELAESIAAENDGRVTGRGPTFLPTGQP